MEIEKAKYIVWIGRGYGNWSYEGFETLKEAVLHETYGSTKVITNGIIEWEVIIEENKPN